MKVRHWFILILLLSLSLTLLGYIVGESYQFGLCFSDQDSNTYDVSCHQVAERIGTGLFSGGISLSLIFLLLSFFPKTFSVWKKFGVWATPLLVIIFATYQGSRGFDLVSPSPEELFKWLSIAYAAISIFIIVRAARKHS